MCLRLLLRSCAVVIALAFVVLTTPSASKAEQFPAGVFPDGGKLPDGRYVLAFGAENATYVGVIEYDATGAIVATDKVFTNLDGSYTVSVRSPKILITGTDTYMVSAFAQRMTPQGEERGYIYSERRFGQSEPLVMPTAVNEGAWSYGWGGMASDVSGSKLFSVSHRGDGAWDVYYYLLDKVSGTKLDWGLLSNTTADTQFNPKTLSIAGGNAFLSVWSDYSGSYQDQSGSAVLGRIYEPGFGFWADSFQVNLTTTGNQGDIDASGGRWELANYFLQNIGDDRVLIAYLSGDSPTANIYARIYEVTYDSSHNTPPMFSPLSNTEISIGTNVVGNKRFLSAVTLDNGSVLITYVSENLGINTLYSTVLDKNGSILQSDATLVNNVGDDAAPSVVQISPTMARSVWQEDLAAWPNQDGSVYLVNGALKSNDFYVGTGANDVVKGIATRLYDIDSFVSNTIRGYRSTPRSSTIAIPTPSASPRRISPTNWNANRIVLLAGADKFNGSSAPEIIDGGSGINALDGGGGVNTVVYARQTKPVKVTLNGSAQAIVYIGGNAQDTILNIANVAGGLAANNLTGDLSDNVLFGGPLGDTFDGGGGSNTVSYLTSRVGVLANLTSPSGNLGAAKGDTYRNIQNLEGSELADTIYGNGIANVLMGRKGRDSLYGQGGNDVLIGGLGVDILYGGAGSNIFQYRSLREMPVGASASATESIMDFKPSNDKIDVSYIDGKSNVGGLQSLIFIGPSAFSGTAGQLRSFVSGQDCYVQGDVNGDRRPDFSIRLAGVTNANQITLNNFIFR